MKYLSLFKKSILICLSTFAFFSCASKKDIVYFQGIDNLVSKENSNSYEIKIQPDDLLYIAVSADDHESAIPFNLNAGGTTTSGKSQELSISYLVDVDGSIDFPVLGKLKVGGLKRSEILQMLQLKISKYVRNPIINFRLINFKISVQGEVVAPGTYNIPSDRITLIEALGMAHDLTIYGKRDNILIIRENDGVKSYNRVDIRKADFINSPFYYLSQNDVVYVEPSKVKINGAAIGANTGVIMSVAGILISYLTLIISRIK